MRFWIAVAAAAFGVYWLCTHHWAWSWPTFAIGFAAGNAIRIEVKP